MNSYLFELPAIDSKMSIRVVALIHCLSTFLAIAMVN